MVSSDNPALLARGRILPSGCRHKEQEVHLFSCRSPGPAGADNDRDVFNEKPSKEDIISVDGGDSGPPGSRAHVHTFRGYPCRALCLECPQTIENFCVHASGLLICSRLTGSLSSLRFRPLPWEQDWRLESIWVGVEDEFSPKLGDTTDRSPERGQRYWPEHQRVSSSSRCARPQCNKHTVSSAGLSEDGGGPELQRH